MPLSRSLEPEVMDSPSEAFDYDAMDHSVVNRQFVHDLLETGEVAGDVLDLGTGTALIPIELCRRVDDCRVMAIDLSVSMLDLARYNIEVASLRERIELQHIDSKDLPFADGSFGVVMSNSIVHHIAEPLAILRHALRVLRPGGRIFFRDLMRPASEADLERLVETYAGAENEHQQKMFRDSLRAALTVDEVRERLLQLDQEPQNVRATSDRHWTWSVRVPE